MLVLLISSCDIIMRVDYVAIDLVRIDLMTPSRHNQSIGIEAY